MKKAASASRRPPSVLEIQWFWCLRALPRGNALFESFYRLRMHELEREAVFEISDHAALHPAEQNRRFQRGTVLGGDGGARERKVDDAAGHLGAVLERQHRDRVARYDTIVAAVFRQIEDVAVGEPGQLCRELVALSRCRTDRHGEAIVDDAGDLALDAADMVEIGDHAVADIADAGGQQRQPAR